MRFLILPLALLLAASLPAHAAGLPDTGQDTCYSGVAAFSAADGVAASDAASVAGDAGSYPRQDCRYGRDPAATAAALAKTGAGAKGFDYTKIANNGSTLAAGATLGANAGDWACTRDNITGLTWEVKTTSGLRNKDSTYTWYNSDGATNGGAAGTANGGTCSDGSGCDTEKFVADVNLAALCGYADWRMPTPRELLTLVHAGAVSPAIDTAYFPNTLASFFWSASAKANDSSYAWRVDFADGAVGTSFKVFLFSVRLVRGGSF